MEQIVSGILAEQNRLCKENVILNVLQREQKQIETALANMIVAIEQGVITNTTTKRLKELEARQEELDRQILIERTFFYFTIHLQQKQEQPRQQKRCRG